MTPGNTNPQTTSPAVLSLPSTLAVERDSIMASNTPSDLSKGLQSLFIQDQPQQSRDGSENPQLQMPQPRPFTPHNSGDSMLQSSTHSPPRSQYSPSTNDTPIITRSPPRLHSSSSNPLLNAPLMIRAHSSPTIWSPSFPPPAPRSTSPLRSPKRVRSPFRHASVDDGYLSVGGSTLSPDISSISEDAELEITPRSNHTMSSPYASLTFPRPLRRRPASPLRSLNNARAASVPASPNLFATYGSGISANGNNGKFNETFPPDLPYYARSLSLSSSVPSTPTSARSRSPSISSLETIPDTPDAEMLAVEEDKKERQERRQEWDLYGSGGTSGGSARSDAGGGPRGFSAGRDKRKRWSVCGAEKRSDLNLETIWED